MKKKVIFSIVLIIAGILIVIVNKIIGNAIQSLIK